MDIVGAKALKTRLDPSGADDASDRVEDVPEDALPVYKWLGISRRPTDASQDETGTKPEARSASLFSRLGLSFR